MRRDLRCGSDEGKIIFYFFSVVEVFSVRQFPSASIQVFERSPFLRAVFALTPRLGVSFQRNQKF
jgi:hypothetical protein